MKKFLFVSFLFLIAGCGKDDTDEQYVDEPVHENSVEFTVSSWDLPDKREVIQMKKEIYIGGKKVNEFYTYDTLNPLGTMTVHDEDEDKDTLVDKKYDIYMKIAGGK